MGVAALAVELLAVGGCVSACSTPTPPAAEVAAQTAALLEELAVVPRPGQDGAYRRAAFGSAWADTDRDGCNQRRDALAASVDRSRPLVERRNGRCAHDVIAGTWTDPYTGKLLTFTDLTDVRQAQQIPIDHVVALGLAYRYGADRWTPQERLAFATDLTNLQPTARTTNSSKSDHDPAAWRPKRPFQCDYATRYIQVKAKYSLPVDESEKQSLTEMLSSCR